ncbi:MAG: hypothetical protein ACKVHP_23095 [Verrucomicrobiales bacterium]
MIASPDSELLALFVEQHDEQAFGELVRRYQPIVLAPAARHTGSTGC